MTAAVHTSDPGREQTLNYRGDFSLTEEYVPLSNAFSQKAQRWLAEQKHTPGGTAVPNRSALAFPRSAEGPSGPSDAPEPSVTAAAKSLRYGRRNSRT